MRPFTFQLLPDMVTTLRYNGLLGDVQLAGVNANNAPEYHRVVDLDVDIGADAVDYKWVHHIFFTRDFE
jgi:hypothetical protein